MLHGAVLWNVKDREGKLVGQAARISSVSPSP